MLIMHHMTSTSDSTVSSILSERSASLIRVFFSVVNHLISDSGMYLKLEKDDDGEMLVVEDPTSYEIANARVNVAVSISM